VDEGQAAQIARAAKQRGYTVQVGQHPAWGWQWFVRVGGYTSRGDAWYCYSRADWLALLRAIRRERGKGQDRNHGVDDSGIIHRPRPGR
jgi:hypothetical protein